MPSAFWILISKTISLWKHFPTITETATAARPFDRMIIAQAIAEDFTIITHDQQFAAYEPLVKILWN